MDARYNILTISAAAAILASCTAEPVQTAVPVSFEVSVPATKAVEDGSLVDILYIGVFNSDGTAYDMRSVRRGQTGFGFSLPLVMGETYDIALWAQSSQSAIFSVPEGDVRNVAADYADAAVNNASDDAYTLHKQLTIKGDRSVSLALKRAVALVKVFSTTSPVGSNAGPGDYTVDMTVEGCAATAFNALTGTCSGAAESVTFAPGSIVGTETQLPAGVTTEICYAYLLPSGSDAGRLGVHTYNANGGLVGKFEAKDVPVQANYRSNLTGELF